jgi:hypothetical protein
MNSKVNKVSLLSVNPPKLTTHTIVASNPKNMDDPKRKRKRSESQEGHVSTCTLVFSESRN